MKYSKNKCKCIAGKRITCMGTKSDEHLRCHNCGGALFPWERYSQYCGSCRKNSYLNDEPKDKLNQWGYPTQKEFWRMEDKEEQLREKIWKNNLNIFDRIKIKLGIKSCNEYSLYTLDELRSGKK